MAGSFAFVRLDASRAIVVDGEYSGRAQQETRRSDVASFGICLATFAGTTLTEGCSASDSPDGTDDSAECPGLEVVMLEVASVDRASGAAAQSAFSVGEVLTIDIQTGSVQAGASSWTACQAGAVLDIDGGSAGCTLSCPAQNALPEIQLDVVTTLPGPVTQDQSGSTIPACIYLAQTLL